jgi:prophage regulatory protein
MLSKRQVTEMVWYSHQHIALLEAAGLFPIRVKLGNNRVGWVESEGPDLYQKRIDERGAHDPPSYVERELHHILRVIA